LNWAWGRHRASRLSRAALDQVGRTSLWTSYPGLGQAQHSSRLRRRASSQTVYKSLSRKDLRRLASVSPVGSRIFSHGVLGSVGLGAASRTGRVRRATEVGPYGGGVRERIGDSELHRESLLRQHGDRAPHELVKQGHCERDVTVRRAVDHPFPDQVRPSWAQASQLVAKSLGDAAHAVRTRS